MIDLATTKHLYETLAARCARDNQAEERDHFLLLAADAAYLLGQFEEADRLRGKLLEANPNHLLKAYATFSEALFSHDVADYLADLRRRYPPSVAEKLLAGQALEDAPILPGGELGLIALERIGSGIGDEPSASAPRPGGEREESGWLGSIFSLPEEVPEAIELPAAAPASPEAKAGARAPAPAAGMVIKPSGKVEPFRVQEANKPKPPPVPPAVRAPSRERLADKAASREKRAARAPAGPTVLGRAMTWLLVFAFFLFTVGLLGYTLLKPFWDGPP